MIDRPISRTNLIAVLVATTAALFARAWLQINLRQGGMANDVAADVSYLIVPPVLALLLLPIWRSEKPFLRAQFRRADLGWRIVARAVVIGVLLRLIWWCQVIAGVSFGFYRSANPEAIIGPQISFNCGPPGTVILGFLVMAVLVPLIEEVVHRAYVFTAVRRRGVLTAILVSALVFAVFHRLHSWPFSFLAGVVFGVMYWATQSLWSTLISHSTINGLIQVDWRCLSSYWNPRIEELPVLGPGLASIVIFAVCSVVLVMVLRKMTTEARAIRPGSQGL